MNEIEFSNTCKQHGSLQIFKKGGNILLVSIGVCTVGWILRFPGKWEFNESNFPRPN